MDYYEKISKLKKFTDSVGTVYGTEDFNIYLYSLVKMTKPRSILELGTGLGSSSLWIALALQENNQGTLFTIDDGSEWERLKTAKDLFGEYFEEEYPKYISGLVNKFEFQKEIKFYNQKVSHFNFNERYDMVFSDFSHGPYFILKLISDILPMMEDNSFIFIDSASTYYSSFHTLEALINMFNLGKVPRTVEELVDKNMLDKFYKKVQSSKFELTHVIENKDRSQNSTAQIKILPIDIMPQPRMNIRF